MFLVFPSIIADGFLSKISPFIIIIDVLSLIAGSFSSAISFSIIAGGFLSVFSLFIIIGNFLFLFTSNFLSTISLSLIGNSFLSVMSLLSGTDSFLFSITDSTSFSISSPLLYLLETLLIARKRLFDWMFIIIRLFASTRQ